MYMSTKDGYEYACNCIEDTTECKCCLYASKLSDDFQVLFEGISSKMYSLLEGAHLRTYICSAEIMSTGYLEHMPAYEMDLDILYEQQDEETSAFLHLKGDGSTTLDYCNTLQFPHSIMLGHSLNMTADERDKLVEYIERGIGKVIWDKSDTTCIQVMNPFKQYESFRRFVCGTLIKNTIIKSKFYENVCGKLYHPNNVLGKRAIDEFISEFNN
mmetsp:Transcript_22818/g.65188  ORF Transcript_22818/g.65188 Transcript_22818/m.65188 type:complete len:214 (+) Transcript_22818:54-695(+)